MFCYKNKIEFQNGFQNVLSIPKVGKVQLVIFLETLVLKGFEFFQILQCSHEKWKLLQLQLQAKAMYIATT